jgi:hypothetical protein
MTILVVDAQGGGLGKALIQALRSQLEKATILGVGTNSNATLAMIKAGATEGATGENSIVVTSKKADIIVGPMGLIIANSMLGEITPKMAEAIAESSASKVLIPFQHCDTYLVGVKEATLAELVKEAVDKVVEIIKEKK